MCVSFIVREANRMRVILSLMWFNQSKIKRTKETRKQENFTGKRFFLFFEKNKLNKKCFYWVNRSKLDNFSETENKEEKQEKYLNNVSTAWPDGIKVRLSKRDQFWLFIGFNLILETNLHVSVVHTIVDIVPVGIRADSRYFWVSITFNRDTIVHKSVFRIALCHKM